MKDKCNSSCLGERLPAASQWADLQLKLPTSYDRSKTPADDFAVYGRQVIHSKEATWRYAPTNLCLHRCITAMQAMTPISLVLFNPELEPCR